MNNEQVIMCPSAQHDTDGARIFAVVGGTVERPETAYLEKTQPITEELLKLVAPVTPAEVFRFAAPCARTNCGHFDAQYDKCKLATKTMRLFDASVDKLAKCAIRSTCRWWVQEGPVACQRCAQVATNNYAMPETMRTAADPRNE